MFIHTVYLSSYSAQQLIKGNVELKDDTIKLTIEFTEDEAAQICSIAEAAFRRNQEALIGKASSPLETFRLPPPEPAPVIEAADFSEVPF